MKKIDSIDYRYQALSTDFYDVGRRVCYSDGSFMYQQWDPNKGWIDEWEMHELWDQDNWDSWSASESKAKELMKASGYKNIDRFWKQK